MKFKFNKNPRVFNVGVNNTINIKDFGQIFLEQNEQVTFNDSKGSEYDVCKKDWGYYATPSLNGRLAHFKFNSALVINKDTHRIYIMLVHQNKEKEFLKYIDEENQKIIFWLHREK